MVPDDLYYSKDHEWLRLEGEIGTLGITHHAQAELGDIVFLELPAAGRELRAGEELGTVESVKAVSEIYAPVSGEVVAVNTEIAANPDRSATVNQDPYGGGWLVRIRLFAPEEVAGLLTPQAYRAYLESGAH